MTSISEVTELVVDIETEHEIFMDIGCFLHRTSPAVMELQTTAHSPPNVVEILNSLSKDVESAKELVTQFKTMDISTADLGVKDILVELESLIRNIGEGLNLIPSSTFQGQEYAECAIKSLSREMKSANIQMRSNQQYEPGDGGEHSRVKMEEEEHEEVMETDLYEVHADASRDNSSSFVDTQNNEMPRLMDFLRGMSFGRQRSYGSSSKSLKTLPQVAEYMEPLYETFFCPLTKKIMEDPVTIGSGVTYERKAITEWFNKCEEGLQDIVCPLTGYKLESRTVNSNLALKITIDEWKERNEATRIKVARAALSLASSESMIREALKDLLHLGRKKKYNKVQIRNVGIIPLLVQLMEHELRKVRCEAIETLQLLVEDDEESKVC